MKLFIYVLKDKDVDEYGKLQLFETEKIAIRFLASLIKNNNLASIAKKFDLVKLGEYDSTTAKIELLNSPVLINGSEVDLETFDLKLVKEVK